MCASTGDDVHTPFVEQLRMVGDWAGLVRYWIAHGNESALAAAITVVQGQAQQGEPWHSLANFLKEVQENRADPSRKPPRELLEALPPEGREVLVLLELQTRLVMCEVAAGLPGMPWDEVIRNGPEAARRAAEVGRLRNDPAVTAYALWMQGHAHRATRNMEAARASFREALAAYRALARQRPEVYRLYIGKTLHNLGTLQRDLGELGAARTSYNGAVECYRRDAQTRPTACLEERQRALSNLGRLLLREAPELGWPDRQAARDAFREARDCAESFRESQPHPQNRRRVNAETLQVYQNLVRVNVDLWLFHGDRGALHEAVETAEASRDRTLMEMLADEVLQPDDAPPHLVDEFRTLRRRLLRALQRLD